MVKVMNAAEFVTKAKSIVHTKTAYQLGTFGNKSVGGKRQWDCSGLIKGILWGYPENGKYGSHGVSDQNANTIISHCLNVSSDFSNIRSGEVVWINGHIGIYIGNGEVIEATPKWNNGVQISICANIRNGGEKSRKWTKHGQLQYIEYEKVNRNNEFSTWVKRLQKECNRQGFSQQKIDGIPGKNTLAACPTLSKKSKGEVTRLMQERLAMLNYSVGKIDGINSIQTQSAIQAFQKDHGLVSDGIVGKKTWQQLLMI